MIFQVPEFLTHFLQVKVSSGLHRNPEGPQMLDRELCLTLSPRDPWYIQG